MNDYLIYLALPPYLAQWYANECEKVHNRNKPTCPLGVYQFPNPVKPVRGSQESDLLQIFLEKQPSAIPAPRPMDASIAIVVPSFPGKEPSYYNYLPPEACKALAELIRRRFAYQLFNDLNRFANIHKRTDWIITAWMESHGIEYNDTNWNTIAKIYQRKKDCYRHLKGKKKKC